MAALWRRARLGFQPDLLQNPRFFSSGLSRTDAAATADEDEARGSLAVSGDDLRSRIFRLRHPKRSATAALERWVSEGRQVSASELRLIARDLKRSQRYKHALEVSSSLYPSPLFHLRASTQCF